MRRTSVKSHQSIPITVSQIPSIKPPAMMMMICIMQLRNKALPFVLLWTKLGWSYMDPPAHENAQDYLLSEIA